MLTYSNNKSITDKAHSIINYVCIILPMTAFVVFHQWLKKYSKRHKYSKTDYIATKPTDTDNPPPASIQPSANPIFHINFCRFFFSIFIINASIHYNVNCTWLNSWIMQLSTDTNNVNNVTTILRKKCVQCTLTMLCKIFNSVFNGFYIIELLVIFLVFLLYQFV